MNLFKFIFPNLKKVYKTQDQIIGWTIIPTHTWANRPEIASIDISKDDKGYFIRVHLTKALPDNVKIPKIVDGVRIIPDIVGEIKAYNKE